MLLTLVTMHNGQLKTELLPDEHDRRISRRRWNASIAPAITLLRALGGERTCYVIHQPHEIDT